MDRETGGISPPRSGYHMSEAPWRAQKWKERDMGTMQRRDTARRTRRDGKESSFSSSWNSGTNSFQTFLRQFHPLTLSVPAMDKRLFNDSLMAFFPFYDPHVVTYY